MATAPLDRYEIRSERGRGTATEDGHKRMILIVEDDDDLRELEARLLRQAEYRVATARDGVEALDRVAEEMPALILLDMSMPGMDGQTFVAEFHSRYQHRTSIVIVTAGGNAQKWAAKISADGYLSKPFTADGLIQTVERFTTGALRR
jgi:chemosensory pili system protein ChpA (sensor histidine kinase/response regulator)